MVGVGRRTLLAAVAVLALAGCNKDGGSGGGGGGKAETGPMVMGSPGAKVAMVEYLSVTCSHCARFNSAVFPQFKAKYIDTGKVSYEQREILTPPSQVAAAGFLLARCAGKDKYFAVVDSILNSQEDMFRSNDFRGGLLRIAQSTGMSEDQFESCVSDKQALAALNARVEKAARDDNISSTPTFVINGKKYEGEQSMEQLDAIIQPLLK